MLEVFILNNLKLFRINTYEKRGGKGRKRACFAQFWRNLNPFRINTFEKQGEGGGSPQTLNSLLCQKAVLHLLSFLLPSEQVLIVAHLIPSQLQLTPQHLTVGT